MFKNLKAEMARQGLTGKKVAAAIGIPEKAFSNRMRGRTAFLFRDMVVIKNTFFPNLRIEYLFFEMYREAGWL